MVLPLCLAIVIVLCIAFVIVAESCLYHHRYCYGYDTYCFYEYFHSFATRISIIITITAIITAMATINFGNG